MYKIEERPGSHRISLTFGRDFKVSSLDRIRDGHLKLRVIVRLNFMKDFKDCCCGIDGGPLLSAV